MIRRVNCYESWNNVDDNIEYDFSEEFTKEEQKVIDIIDEYSPRDSKQNLFKQPQSSDSYSKNLTYNFIGWYIEEFFDEVFRHLENEFEVIDEMFEDNSVVFLSRHPNVFGAKTLFLLA